MCGCHCGTSMCGCHCGTIAHEQMMNPNVMIPMNKLPMLLTEQFFKVSPNLIHKVHTVNDLNVKCNYLKTSNKKLIINAFT